MSQHQPVWKGHEPFYLNATPSPRTAKSRHVRQLDAVASRVLSGLAETSPVLAGVNDPVFVDVDDISVDGSITNPLVAGKFRPFPG